MLKGFITLVAAGMPVLLAATTDAPLSPVMNQMGRIEVGSKAIAFKRSYMQYQMLLANTLGIEGGSIFNMGKNDLGVVFFADKVESKKKDSVTYTARITAERGGTETFGDFHAELTLRPDGLILVSNTYKLDQEKKTAVNPYFYMRIQDKLSGFYQLGSRKMELKDKDVRFFKRPKLSFTFYPDNPEKCFTLIPLNYEAVNINPARGMFSLSYDKNGRMEFLLDLRGEKKLDRSEEFYANIDFFKIDQLRLPRYKASRNLIQNPSFEGDLRYFALKSYGSYAPFKEFETYTIDDKEAYSGKRSLKIMATQAKITSVLPIGTFAIPMVPGKKYVLSAYVKTDSPGEAYLYIDGRGFAPYLFADRRGRKVDPTGEWKRYSLDFTAPDEFCSIYLSAGIKPNAGRRTAVVWVDALQLEEEKNSEFTQCPVQSMLLSGFRGNCFDLQDNPGFKMRLIAPPQSQGTVKLQVKDFSGQQAYIRTMPFTIPSEGELQLDVSGLTEAIRKDHATGVFVATTTVILNGDKTEYVDYSRFAVINRQNGTHKHRNIFNVSTQYANILSPEGVDLRLNRLKEVGYGSVVYTECEDSVMEKALFEKLQSFGMTHMGCDVMNKRTDAGSFSEGTRKITGIRNLTDPTPEQLLEIEEICYLKAKNRPWVKLWFFSGEIEGFKPFIETPKAVGAVLAAMYKGLKRGNPAAMVHTGGTPWNITESGLKWMRNYLQMLADHAPGILFDGTAMHTYQEGPENPDLDKEIADYLAMLEPFGYADKPIYFDEGMNYFEYFIPARGMTPFFGNSGDPWYVGMLSYDLGFAEKMSAAFTARHYLAVLKYAGKVACQTEWGHRRNFFDADCTIGAKLKGINTLSAILGNADYRKTINFAPMVRSYLFERADKTPIAAVWGFDRAVDHGEKSPPNFSFELAGDEYQFLDFMAKPINCKPVDNHVSVPVGSFPFFIVGKIGHMDKLENFLSSAVNLSDKQLPIVMTVMPESGTTARLALHNNSMTVMDIKLVGTLNTEKQDATLTVLPQGHANLDMVGTPQSGSLKQFRMEMTATAPKFEAKKLNISGAILPIERIGAVDENTWKNVSPVTLAQDAIIKVSATDKKLFLLITIPKALEKTPKTIIINPAVTPGNWFLPLQKFQDLFVFELCEKDVFVHAVPEVQAASGPETPKKNRIDPRIELTKVLDGDRLTLMVGIPKESIMPLSLAKKSRLGLNITIGLPPSMLSLAPIADYQSTAEPGKVNFALVVIE